ncbi:hypothetical protein [Aeromonas piscicola]|uniref:hypothetical protein n=1 Tax=Aeromonas piscicola TaxID=600645 RepID=UPI0021F91C95|nr:hypothetical protein [Aeromonas piscicola]MCW0507028.1 hypothetical protein [Aeromonas piscicola]
MTTQTQAIETSNLLSETMAFLASKAFHYDEEEIFQLVESVEQGTLQKRGNSYVFASHGKQIELQHQMPKNMWDHYSTKAEKAASPEMAKKIENRRQSLKKIRQRYELTKEIESKLVACGSYVRGNNELYVYLFPRGIVILHIDFSGKAAKTFCYDTRLDELYNYATKKSIVLNKRAENRGGFRDYAKKEVE